MSQSFETPETRATPPHLAPRDKPIYTSSTWMNGLFDYCVRAGVYLEPPETWQAAEKAADKNFQLLAADIESGAERRKFLDEKYGKDVVDSAFMTYHIFREKIPEARQAIMDFGRDQGLDIQQISGEEKDRHYMESSDCYFLPPYTLSHKAAQVIRKHLQELIPDIQIPTSQTMEEYEENPTFPIFAKMERLGDGFGKIFIETSEDFARFSRFLETPDAAGLRDEFTMQEFISTPSEQATSYRVAMAATGDILYSALRYTIVDEFPNAQLGTSDLRLAPLYDKNSEFYFGRNTKVMSTTSGFGGGSIVLDGIPCSEGLNAKDKEILRAHGLDENNPEIPDTLRRQSRQIGIYMGEMLNMPFSVVDWVQDEKTGKFYFLETQYTRSCDAFTARYVHVPEIFAERIECDRLRQPVVKYQLQAALGAIVANGAEPPDFHARDIPQRVGCAVLDGILPISCDRPCPLKDKDAQESPEK